MTNKKKTLIISIAIVLVIVIISVLIYVIPGNDNDKKTIESNKTTQTEINKSKTAENPDNAETSTEQKSDSEVTDDVDVKKENKDNTVDEKDESKESENEFDDYKTADIDEETKEAIESLDEQFTEKITAVETEAAPDVDYKRGNVTDSAYESEFLGVKFNVPKGWKTVSKEELDKLNTTEGTACEFQCYNETEGSDLMIVFEKLPAETITPDIYIESIANSIRNTPGFEVENLKSDETINIAGEEYKVLSYSIKQNNNSYHQKYFVRQIGLYMAVISTSGRSESSDNSELLNNFIKY